jgi:uncharacterized membrane protein HdeD (DUF308 family)
LQVFNSLEEYAKDKKNIFNTQILTGVCIGFIGIFINSVISLTSTKTDAIIIGWLLIVFGIIKIILGVSKEGNHSSLFDINSTKENPYLESLKVMYIKN